MVFTFRCSLPLLLLMMFPLMLLLRIPPPTGASNVKSLGSVKPKHVKSLGSVKPSAFPTAESSVRNVGQPKVSIVSKLKRFDIPVDNHDAATSRSLVRDHDRHIKTWESSKTRVDQLASFVKQRASAYSQWLISNNRSALMQDSQLMKLFNAQNKAAAVLSTIDSYSGDYYVVAWVGSTPQLQRLRLETSTGLSWIQCQTCTNCFQQPEDLPVFDPTASETYSAIGCDNTICSSDWGFGGGVTLSCVEVDDSNSTCGYSLTYVDGSSTSGTLALDSVGLDEIGNGAVSLQGLVFGCGHDYWGSFGDGLSGVLGLDRSHPSFISQLSSADNSLPLSFAYCIPARVAPDENYETEGHIIFGDVQEYYTDYSFSRTPILSSYINPDAYYVGLTSIGVGDYDSGIYQEELEIQSDGSGGTILSTGVEGLWLPEGPYAALAGALHFADTAWELTQDVQTTDHRYTGLCYNVDADDAYSGVPDLKLSFLGTDDDSEGGVELVVPKFNYFLPLDSGRTVFCYTVYKQGTGSLSVIGHNMLANRIVQIDLDQSEIGFASNKGCVLPGSYGGGGGDQEVSEGEWEEEGFWPWGEGGEGGRHK